MKITDKTADQTDTLVVNLLLDKIEKRQDIPVAGKGKNILITTREMADLGFSVSQADNILEKLANKGIIKKQIEGDEPIKAFLISTSKNDLNDYLFTKHSPTLGISITNQEYIKKVVAVLEDLVGNKNNLIRYDDFKRIHNGLDILTYLEAYSDLITLEKLHTGGIAQSGDWYEDEFYNIVIHDRDGIHRLSENLKKESEEIYESGVSKLFEKSKGVKWFCENIKNNGKRCGHFIKEFTDPKDLKADLDIFGSGKSMPCKKCRGLNYFKVRPDGTITFNIIDKKIPRL